MEKEEKNKIKSDLIDKINKLLEGMEEQYKIENISILNNKDFTGFMGSVRVYNQKNLESIKESLENILKDYGQITVNQRHIVPCCELPYHYLTFNMKILKD